MAEKYNKFIEDLTQEYKLRKETDMNTISFMERLKNTLKYIEDNVNKKCKNELEALQKVVSKNKNGEIVPYPGKEEKASQIFSQLQKCSGEIGAFSVGLQNLLIISENVIKIQTNKCLEDSIVLDNEDFTKNRIRGCIEKTYKYTNKTFQKIINDSLDVFDENIKKL